MRRITSTLVAASLAVVLAACGGDDGGDTATTPEADVVLTGTDSLKWDKTEVSAAAGEISIGLISGPAVQHNVVIEGVNDDAVIVEAAAGQSATGTVTLDAGTYTYYCDIAGHRAGGMEGTLTVN